MLVNMCVAWVQNYFNPAFLCGHLYPRFCEDEAGEAAPAAPFTKYFPDNETKENNFSPYNIALLFSCWAILV